VLLNFSNTYKNLATISALQQL